MAAILQLRRGTTPSTTIAEPYFNTSLGTLQVGDGSNTITLVKIGSNTGNVILLGDLSVSGTTILTTITGSNLYITENVTIDGNIHIGGNITLGSGSDGDIVNVNAPLSGSIIPTETSLYDIGATDKKYRNLYVVSASIDNISLPGSGILSSSNENFTDFSQSVDLRLDVVEESNTNSDFRLNSLESFTSSQETRNLTLGTYTASVDSKFDTLGTYTTSVDDRLSQLESDSGSQDIRLDNLESFTSSQETRNLTLGTYTSSNDDNITKLFATASDHESRIDEIEGTFSSSVDSRLDYLEGSFSSSVDDRLDQLQVHSGSTDSRLDSLEGVSGSYATTGSNLFIGNEIISGNLGVSGSVYITSPSYPTSGSSIRIDETRTSIFLRPSGSTTSGNIQLYDAGDSRSILILNASQTSIGSNATSTAYGNNDSQNYIRGNTQFFQNITSSANIEAVKFYGDGENLTNVTASYIDYSNIDNKPTLVSGSSQINVNDTQNFQTYSSSVDFRLDALEGDFSTSVDSRLDNIENYTSSLKDALDVSGSGIDSITTVRGNLVVQGTTTAVQSSTLNISDINITLASGSNSSATSDGAGITIAGADVSLIWNHTDQLMQFDTKVSSSVGFKGDGSELTGVTATDIDFYDISNKPPLISGSSQVTFSLDMRYLEIDGDDVVSGSSQITITDTTGFTTFSGSLKSTDDGQDSRLGNLESFTSSQETKNSTLGTLTSSIDNRLSNLESRSGSQEEKNSTLATYTGSIDTYITNLVSFTSSQEEKNSTLQSYTESVDSQFTELYSTASNHEDRIDILESFSSSIDTTIKNKLDFEGVVSSSLDTTTISLSIQDGVISGDVIGGIVSGSSQVTESLDLRYLQIDGDGVVSGSDQVTESLDLRYEEIASGTHTLVSGSSQVTESLDSRYEVLGSVSDLVGVRAASGSLGSAAWYNVSGSISDGNPAVIGNAGAVKDYIDEQLLIIGAGDITSIIAGDGISGGADSGPATLTLDTGSQHFIDGVTGIAPTLPNGLVSGSTQVITLLNGSGILSSSIETFEEFSSSVDLRFSGLSTDYNDLENIPSGIVSGSSQVSFNGITDKPSLVSGSSQVLLESANKTGFSGASSITTLGTVTSGDVTAILPSGVISGSSQVDLTQTTSYVTGIKTRLNVEGVISGSSQVNADSITNFDSNVKDKLNADGVISGSSQILLGSGIVSSSQQISDYNTFLEINGDNVVSSSQQISNYGIFAELSGDNLVSSSAQVDHDQTTNFVANKHIDHSSITIGSGKGLEGGGTIETNRSLSLNTGSAHFTDGVKTKLDVEGVISGSDQLTGSLVDLSSDQTINGTKTFNDIVVNGTGSFAYITSVTGDAKIIGDAFIVLNTNTPTSRYAGLSVYDSGSTLSTASFYFDGQTNDWGYEYSSSTGVDYAVTIFGPEYSTKGNPTYLTTNKIPKAVDNHHLNDSNITDDGTTITLGSNVQLNGNLNLTGGISGLSVVSGSDQVLGGTGIVSSSAQIKPLLPSGTVSGSVQVSYPSLSNIPAGIVSGSTQIKPLLPSGIVSGSIQVSYPSLSNIPSGIVSGSVQITKTLQEVTTAGNTTSTSISITNSTASTSKTTGALIVSGGIGTSGDVFAGGDVVAYSSSDRRLKDNIQPIQNPLEKINQIGGYSFEWNVEKQNIYSGKDYGVIAQEIEEILPELVENRENGYKAVKYDKLVSLLIEGIKDLSQQVEELKQKINKG